MSLFSAVRHVFFDTTIIQGNNPTEPQENNPIENVANALLFTNKTTQIINPDDQDSGGLSGYYVEVKKEKNPLISAALLPVKAVTVPLGGLMKLALCLDPVIWKKNKALINEYLQEGAYQTYKVEPRFESVAPNDLLTALPSEGIPDMMVEYLGARDVNALSQVSTVWYNALSPKRMLTLFSAVTTKIFTENAFFNLPEVTLNAHRAGKPTSYEEIQGFQGTTKASQLILSDLVASGKEEPISRCLSPWGAPVIRIRLVCHYPSNLTEGEGTLQELYQNCTGLIKKDVALYLYKQSRGSKRWQCKAIYLNGDPGALKTKGNQILSFENFFKNGWEKIEDCIQYLADIVNPKGIARGSPFYTKDGVIEGPATLTVNGRELPSVSLYKNEKKPSVTVSLTEVFSDIVKVASNVGNQTILRSLTDFKPLKRMGELAKQVLITTNLTP